MKSMAATSLLAFIFAYSCSTYRPSFKGKPLSICDKQNEFRSAAELNKLLEEKYATTGLLILQNGEVVFQYGAIEDTGYIASCRKSILSILYGKHVESGKINLKQTIGSLGIDEKEGLLEIEKQATVEDIINSRSGVFYTPANKGYDEKNILERGSVEPGEYFVYNNWDFNVAGFILEKQTGKTIYEELENQLAIPLGFEDWNIKNQKKKYTKRKSQYPAYHMYISARDIAKVGQLMLDDGVWEGQQLISKDWIERITTSYTSVEEVNRRNGKNIDSEFQFSYSHMWHIIENFRNSSEFEGAYSASGYGGQYITVIPKLDMVIAHKTALKKTDLIGWTYNGVTDYQYWDLVHWIATNS